MRMLLANLAHRWERSLALVLAIAVATGCFTLLSANATTEQLQSTGTVEDNYRPIYTRPPCDRRVRSCRSSSWTPATLSASHGGISLDQWHAVQAVPGVAVAAPVAVLGYVTPTVRVPIDLRRFRKDIKGDQLLRISVGWVDDAGLTQVHDRMSYLYATDQPVEWDGS